MDLFFLARILAASVVAVMLALCAGNSTQATVGTQPAVPSIAASR